MTCRELVDFLMEYLDRELPPEQQAAFERHLNRCPPCVEFLQSYQTTRRLECQCYQSTEEVEGVPEQLVQAILAAKRASGEKPAP